MLMNARGDASKTAITVKWNTVTNASGYDLYAGAYKKPSKLIKTLKNSSAVTATISNLKKATIYKLYVKAYRIVGSEKVYIKSSETLYITTRGGKYVNPKSISLSFKSTAIKKGTTKQIKAQVNKSSSSGTLLKCISQLRYESSDEAIATVSRKGKISAKKEGKCCIYVYGSNGIYKKITITVLL